MLAVVERCERDAEAVLPVPDQYVWVLCEFLRYRTSFRRADKSVVDLQVFEYQRYSAFLRDIQRVEPGESVCSAEDEGTVRQQARSPVGELIAAYAVRFEIIDEFAHGPVVFPKAVHRGSPYIALPVLLQGADVQAGDSRHPDSRSVLDGPQQSVRHGCGPDVSGPVLEQFVGYHDRTAYARIPFLLREFAFGGFHCVCVHLEQVVIEGCREQFAGFGHHEVRDESPFIVLCQRDIVHAVVPAVISEKRGSRASYPDDGPVVFGNGDRIHHVEAFLRLQGSPVETAPDCPELVRKKHPDISVRRLEYPGCPDIADIRVREQMRNFHSGDTVALQVVHEQPVGLRAYPQAPVLVIQGYDSLVQEIVRQVFVTVELVLVLIRDDISMVSRSEPEVVPAVAEHCMYLGGGEVERESRFVLECDAACRTIVVENSLSYDLKQDGPVIDCIDEIDISVHDPALLPDGFGEPSPLHRPGVEYAYAAHA